MPSIVEPIAIPADCTLNASARTASFADAYTVLVPRSSLSATQIYAAVVQETPGWVKGLMGLRNQVVKWLGLKNLGQLAVL